MPSPLRRLRAGIYDAIITGMTAGWYRSVLQGLPPNCHVLDVGIGTGSALLANSKSISEKALRITGIDIDADYVERCRAAVTDAKLAAQITVHLQSVYDHCDGPYDAVYFSGSFMLLPDPIAALRHVSTLLNPAGRLYFTQTFEHRRSPLLETLKPWLRHITTIDFGRVTYESDLQRAFATAGVEIETQEVLHAGRRRTSMLIIARPSRHPTR